MAVPTVTNSAVDYGSNVTTKDLTLAISSGSDRVLVCYPAYMDADKTASISSITFDPGGSYESTFTQKGSSIDYDYGAAELSVSAWYLDLTDSAGSASYTVRITASEQCNRLGGSVWEMSGAYNSDPLGTVHGRSGNTDTLTANVPTTATDSLVGAGGVMLEEVTFTAGSGDTEETEQNGSSFSQWSGYTSAATKATYTVSATSSDSPATDYWVFIACEIRSVAPTLPAYDDFDGYTSGQTLGAQTNWTLIDGVSLDIQTLSGSDLVIDANTSTYTAGTFDVVSPNADQYSEAEFDITAGSNLVGVAVRCSGDQATATYYVLEWSATAVWLGRVVNGSWTTLDSDTSTTNSQGDVMKLEVEGTGATVTLTCYTNDSPDGRVGTSGVYEDTNAARIVTAGKLGVFAFGSSTGGLNNWEGGNIAAEGPGDVSESDGLTLGESVDVDAILAGVNIAYDNAAYQDTGVKIA